MKTVEQGLAPAFIQISCATTVDGLFEIVGLASDGGVWRWYGPDEAYAGDVVPREGWIACSRVRLEPVCEEAGAT